MSLLKNIFTDFNKVKPVYDDSKFKISNSALPKEIETVVIGGGLAGLSTALDLASNKRSVVVLDAKNIGDGPSGRSGGQLWPGFEESYSDLKEGHGENYAKNVMNMVHESLKVVHSRAATDPTNCDFKPGVLLVGKTGPQAEWIEEECQALKEAGFDWVSYVDSDELKKDHVNSNGYYLNGMLFKGDQEGQQYGHLNPKKLTMAVAKLAQDAGAGIVENNPVKGLKILEDGRYEVSTPQGKIIARNVVMATGADTIRPKGVDYDLLPSTHVPVQTVILSTEPIPEKLARKMVPGDACFCDAADAAMNYGRLIEVERPANAKEQGRYYRLTLGGADALGQAQTAFDIMAIEKEMHAMWPQLKEHGVKIDKIHGGNCDLSTSAMPYIIEPKKGFYAVGGFSGQGMVNTTLYGGAVAEKILGKDEKFETLQHLNPEFYSSKPGLANWMNRALAWGHAAKELIPTAIEAKREEKAELPHRERRQLLEESRKAAEKSAAYNATNRGLYGNDKPNDPQP